jgi:hypothetical protein
VRWALLATLVAFAPACTKSGGDGPAEVKWDRDACRSCGMVLSDRNFAAQLRGGPKDELQKFDDIGCALTWLAKQSWADDPKTRLWVAKYGSGEWLDARAAHYLEGKTSPMGFNFGAVGPEQPGLSFEEVKAKVLAGRGGH